MSLRSLIQLKFSNMMELLNVYRFQFVKREPFYVASTSFEDAIKSVMRDSNLCPEEGDEITSISHIPNHNLFVYV